MLLNYNNARPYLLLNHMTNTSTHLHIFAHTLTHTHIHLHTRACKYTTRAGALYICTSEK